MTTSNDIPLIGYADRLSAGPGETVEFKVSSRSEQPFEARLVRVICGDPNPDGPGIKEVPVASDFEGSWPSRAQDAHLGSHARVRSARPEGAAMTVVATVWPTRPEVEGQGIVSWLSGDGQTGLALVLDGARGAVLRAARAEGGGEAEEVAVGKPLRPRAWYRVWASLDTDAGTLTVGQASLDGCAVVDDAGTARRRADGPLSPAGAEAPASSSRPSEAIPSVVTSTARSSGPTSSARAPGARARRLRASRTPPPRSSPTGTSPPRSGASGWSMAGRTDGTASSSTSPPAR